MRRAALQLSSEAVDGVGRAFGYRFDAAVGQVSNSARDAQPAGCSEREPAKAHSLNIAFNNKSPGYRHKLNAHCLRLALSCERSI